MYAYWSTVGLPLVAFYFSLFPMSYLIPSPQVTDDTDDSTFYFTLVPLFVIDSIILYWISLSVTVFSVPLCVRACGE